MKDKVSSPQPSLYQDVVPTSSERGIRIRDRALAALTDLAATASMSLDVDEVLRQALERALGVVGVEAGAISVLDETTNELVFRVQQGWRVHDFVGQGIRVPVTRGLSGLAVETGRPIVTGDVSHDSRVAIPEFRDEAVQAMALAPMRARGRVLGVLGVMSYTPYDFGAEEITFICAIADQIGVALDNARLFEEARCRMQELTTLQEVSTQVASTLDLWTVLEAITAATLDLTGASVVEMFLYESRTDKLAFATALSKDGARAPVSGYPSGEGPVARAARTCEVVVLDDLAASDADLSRWRGHGMRALAALPSIPTVDETPGEIEAQHVAATGTDGPIGAIGQAEATNATRANVVAHGGDQKQRPEQRARATAGHSTPTSVTKSAGDSRNGTPANLGVATVCARQDPAERGLSSVKRSEADGTRTRNHRIDSPGL